MVSFEERKVPGPLQDVRRPGPWLLWYFPGRFRGSSSSIADKDLFDVKKRKKKVEAYSFIENE